MSDVPAGALWTAAAVAALGDSRRSAALSGLAAAAGLLVRPNLVLLTLVPFGQSCWPFADVNASSARCCSVFQSCQPRSSLPR